MRGLRAALTPQVSIMDTVPQPATVTVTGPPPIGSFGKITCPSPFVPYAAYIDPAGNYQYPGCMMPGGVTSSQTTPNPPTNTLPVDTPVPTGTSGPPPGFLNPNNPPTTNVALLPNSGQMPKGQGNVSNIQTGTVYRFILAMGGGYATGASLNGCSQTNSNNCDPKFFSTLSDAIAYALRRGEIPYQVLTTQEPWDIIAGNVGIDPSRIYNPDGTLGSHGLGTGTLALIGIGLFLLLRS